MAETWSGESDLLARLEAMEIEARRLAQMRDRASSGDLRDVVESDLRTVEDRIALLRRRLRRPGSPGHPAGGTAPSRGVHQTPSDRR